MYWSPTCSHMFLYTNYISIRFGSAMEIPLELNKADCRIALFVKLFKPSCTLLSMSHVQNRAGKKTQRVATNPSLPSSSILDLTFSHLLCQLCFNIALYWTSHSLQVPDSHRLRLVDSPFHLWFLHFFASHLNYSVSELVNYDSDVLLVLVGW